MSRRKKGADRCSIRVCVTCNEPKDYSRFTLRENPDGTVRLDAECKECQSKAAAVKRGANPARAIVWRRAATRAHQLGVSRTFLLLDLKWETLIPPLEAAITVGLCQRCGHRYNSVADITFDHGEPPRDELKPDWAREHADNIRLRCKSCNVSKRDMAYSDWLDSQEVARVSHANGRPQTQHQPLPLFAGLEDDGEQ